jgi:hypothetical protein
MYHFDNPEIESDSVLMDWVNARFATAERPVHISYGSREDCTVPRGNLVVKQVVLSDQRLLRVDMTSPNRGAPGAIFIRAERKSR